MNDATQKILILGLGAFQVPLIERAKGFGLETHGVSVAGPHPGISLVDAFHCVDTTDIPAVVELARGLDVDAAATSGSDVCVPTLGAVCDALGLPGVSRCLAETISTKHRFRQFLAERELPCPDFVSGPEWEGIRSRVEAMSFPVLVKPVDSSGSRGVTRLEAYEPRRARECFQLARRASRSGWVCVESALRGAEVGGDAILSEGKLAFLAITSKHMDGVVVRGHSLPADLAAEQRAAVGRVLEECCRELGYRSGVLNFDLMVDGTEVGVIELGARPGGNGMSAVIERALGQDVESAVVRLALGEPPLLAPPCEVRGCASLVFGADTAGVLTAVSDPETLRKACPYVQGMLQLRRPGDAVEPFVHNGNLLGYVVFDCPDSETYEERAREIRTALCVQVRP